ncbi:MAG: ComEC/Rec2 family competence protein, partial [Giesbergeria sp.]
MLAPTAPDLPLEPGAQAPLRRNRPIPNSGVLVAALLGVVAGSALQIQQPSLWTATAYAACMGAALVLGIFALKLRSGHGRLASVLVGLSAVLVFFALCGLRSLHYADTALDPALEGKDIAIVAVVSGLPQPMEAGVRFRVRVLSAKQQGAVRLPEQIDLGWYRNAGDEGVEAGWETAPSTPHAGERWQMTVRLKAPHGARNPHGFDYELLQWEQGVQAVGYVRAGRKDPMPERLDTALRYPVLQLRERVRDAILAELASVSEGPADLRAAGVVAALVTGDQRAIDRSDWNVFRATGVAHLVSISGLHITLFAWLAVQVVGALWRRAPRLCLAFPAQSAGLVGGLLLAGLYALFSGWGVPAQRTVLMLAVVVGLRLAGRRWPWPHIWLLACAAVVLQDPWALLQAGFWLSFVAVGALFAINPIAVSASSKSAGARFLSIFREQWSVTVALAPLTLLLFGQVSLVGFLANLVAIPWVTLVITPLAFAGVLWAPLWHLAAWCVQALGWLLGLLASVPWAQFEVASAPLWAGVAAVAGGVLLAARLPWA